MGGCLSSQSPEDTQARQRTQQIDEQLQEDYKRVRKEVKILLLGSGESGKSTVIPLLSLLLRYS
jgi:guanine nucleotide-binding protein G(i) subunit alpha